MATSNTETEFAMDRELTKMSRPAMTLRAGLMRAQGAGVLVVMNAETALPCSHLWDSHVHFHFNVSSLSFQLKGSIAQMSPGVVDDSMYLPKGSIAGNLL